MNYRQPDFVPPDFGGHRSSGIMAISYRKLKEHLRLPPKSIHVYDMIQQLGVVDNGERAAPECCSYVSGNR